jgi:hypothetical protein
MDEGFICEAVGSLVVVRLSQPVTTRVLEECQLCVLETLQQTGSKAVLYDLTEMSPTPVNVLLYQRLLDEHIRHLELRRAIVVPNTHIAHLARLAFGVGDYKLFYDDLEAAKRFLRDASPFSSADWSIRVTEERRLRERRSSPRSSGGRRERDRVNR